MIQLSVLVSAQCSPAQSHLGLSDAQSSWPNKINIPSFKSYDFLKFHDFVVPTGHFLGTENFCFKRHLSAKLLKRKKNYSHANVICCCKRVLILGLILKGRLLEFRNGLFCRMHVVEKANIKRNLSGNTYCKIYSVVLHFLQMNLDKQFGIRNC